MWLIDAVKGMIQGGRADNEDVIRGYVPFAGEGFDHGHAFYGESDYKGRKEDLALVRRYANDVYSCVKLIAVCAAQTPLRLYVTTSKGEDPPLRMKTRAVDSTLTKQFEVHRPHLRKYMSKALEVEEVVEHPILKMLEEVNPLMNQFDFMEALHIYRELTGKSFIFKARDKTTNMPIELWPLEPQKMRPLKSRETLIDKWRYRSGAQVFEFETDDIIYSKDFNPLDMLDGFAPQQAATFQVDLVTEVLRLHRSLVGNRAMPDIAFLGKGTIPDVEKKRFDLQWRNRFGRTRNGGAGLVGGVHRVEKLNLTPEELGHSATLDRARDRIANVYQIPKQMLTADNVNRANMEGGLFFFAKFCLSPRLAKQEQSLNQDLTPEYDATGRLFLAYDDVVPADREFRLRERTENIRIGYTTVNEERAIDGLEPREGGDKARGDGGDPTQNPGSQDGNEDTDEDGGDFGSDGKRVKVNAAPGKKPRARGMVAAMQRHFMRQQRQVLAKLRIMGPGPVDMTAISLDMQSENESLANNMVPFIRRMTGQGFQAARDQLATVGKLLNIDAPHMLHIAEGNTAKFAAEMAQRINETTSKELLRQATIARDMGEPVTAIMERVENVFKVAMDSRANASARTGTKQALESARKEAFKSAGVSRLKWVAGPEPCEICSALDGKIVGTRSNFAEAGDVVGKVTMKAGVPYPPVHPNCRCVIVPVE